MVASTVQFLSNERCVEIMGHTLRRRRLFEEGAVNNEPV